MLKPLVAVTTIASWLERTPHEVTVLRTNERPLPALPTVNAVVKPTKLESLITEEVPPFSVTPKPAPDAPLKVEPLTIVFAVD